MAVEHKAMELRNACLEFALQHLPTVMTTDGYMRLINPDPDLNVILSPTETHHPPPHKLYRTFTV
jgi:hypothetical protein